jgi:hypothetical protein
VYSKENAAISGLVPTTLIKAVYVCRIPVGTGSALESFLEKGTIHA